MPPDRNRTTILVVEDERAMRSFMATILTEAGYAVRLAADGAEGLDALRQQPPDLVLLDLHMPRMTGEAFRCVQRRMAAQLAAVPVIVVSGCPAAEAEGERLGAVGCVRKPFEPASLLHVVAGHARLHVPAPTEDACVVG